MKTFLITLSAFGLMTSMAGAECARHSKGTAPVNVDKSVIASNGPPAITRNNAWCPSFRCGGTKETYHAE